LKVQMNGLNRNEGKRMTSVPIGVVTVSDRASAGIYEDRGGPAILAELRRILASAWHAEVRVIADERRLIADTLIALADIHHCPLIVTTGGTGPAARDVTPEATEDVCTKLMPGFGELMRNVSLKSVPTAILSRQTAGIRGQSLIVNLPGKPTAIAECLAAVFPAVPYCIDLIGGPYLETDPDVCAAFRPRS
jgi:molybdopterin adenylyltransferase